MTPVQRDGGAREMAENVVEGGCLCGAVRYRVEGRPTVSMICHCNSCARAAGASAVAWVTFPAKAFAFLGGEPATLRSSPPVIRRFCPRCGTPLTYENKATPTEIDVTTRSLDDPEAFPPTHHSWVSDAPTWGRPSDGLPAYERSKEMHGRLRPHDWASFVTIVAFVVSVIATLRGNVLWAAASV